jgi:hypothetical protein
MLRDVFYYGDKPNVHPKEKFAKNLDDARAQSVTEHFWIINEFCDYRDFDWDFDFDFLPDEDVWAKDHNNVWPSQHQKDSGTWLCPKEFSDINVYRNDVNPVIRKRIKTNNWIITLPIAEMNFDFSWHPDPTDPPYIYKWGCKYFPVEHSSVIEYHVHGASQVKYMKEIVELLPDWDNWIIPDNIDKNTFDFSWHPDPTDPPYIYKWGCKYYPVEYKSVLEYHVPGASQVKYMKEIVELLPDWDNWIIPDNIDKNTFDFSWRPDPREPKQIYQFGTQHQKTGGPQYIVEGATTIKYMDLLKAKILPTTQNWIIPSNIDSSNFDFSWHPDSTVPPYIYQFGTLLEDIHLKDGPKYITPDNNGEVVYLENVLLNGSLIYPKYTITTTLEDLISQHTNEIFWAIRDNIDYSNFNFDWKPTKEQVFNINVFGSTDSELTQSYFVNAALYSQGYTDKTYIEDKKINELNLSKLFKRPSMFFVDRSNPESQQRFENLKSIYPNLQKTRYLNSWVDTINRCITKSSTELCWILNSEFDYSNFNFDYYPNPWQTKMVHVFGTQWSHWGNTYMVNTETFAEDTKYIKIIEHLSNINFIKDPDKRAKATNCLYDVIVIDHGNKETNSISQLIQNKIGEKQVYTIEYNRSYLHTFRELLEQLSETKDHYVWVCSSVCDYTNFDFTYICDPYTREDLHVFPSDKQKYGDTFLININQLRKLIDNMVMLDDYQSINFNRHQRVNRLPSPIVISTNDTHVGSLQTDFNFPYVTFVTEDNKDITIIDTEPMNLWSEDTKNIIISSTGGTKITVPREAKHFVKKELYDYPYIAKSNILVKSKPLDIVFLSNGEPGADENYEHLLKVTNGLNNRVVRVDGVNGRVNAYHAAAEASNTQWMFTVFAKLKVDETFDWDWQPDRLQLPKHYIFNAMNPVNKLVYGHQAMIAYNKKITLSNQGRGLDFTLDSEHEVVDILSGVANFNTDSWTTWRTSFREALKLCTYPDYVSADRLKIWTTVAQGDFAQDCLNGANDAVEYFDEVAGDYDLLKLSYDWAWLREFYNKKYN